MATPPLTTATRPRLTALSELQWRALGALTALLGVAVTDLFLGPHPRGHGDRLVLAAAACLPIALRRRWPLQVLAVSTVAIGFAMGSGTASLPLGAVLGLAAYSVASQLPRRQSVPATLAAAAALGSAILAAAVSLRSPPLTLEAVEGFLPLAAAWFVGDSVAARRAYLAGLAEQAERELHAESERARQQVRDERVRIARELHDVVAHSLAVITVQAGVGRRLMARRPEAAGDALDCIETIGRAAQEELRVVLGLLREPEGEPAARVPAPRLVDLDELAGTVRAAGIPVQVRVSDDRCSLSPALELSVYRVVQEALTNVVKHAPGASTTVEISVSGGEARVEVTNEATAAPAPAPAPGGATGQAGQAGQAGHGIVGMRERVGAFGGSLAAGPIAGGGFRLLARIPAQGRR